MRIHEVMAENRLKFAQRLNEMSDELTNLAKEVDKNRKQVGISPLFVPMQVVECDRCGRHADDILSRPHFS